jgi:hypothetical protein
MLKAPTGVGATGSTTGGTLPAGTYFYKVTALKGNEESLGSTQVSVTTTGATSSVSVTWTAVSGATSYRVYRGTSSNAQNTFYTDDASPFVDTGGAGTGGTVPAGAAKLGEVQLQSGVVTIVDVDDAVTREALGRHNSIGQFVIAALNNNARSVAGGGQVTLPANT